MHDHPSTKLLDYYYVMLTCNYIIFVAYLLPRQRLSQGLLFSWDDDASVLLAVLRFVQLHNIQ